MRLFRNRFLYLFFFIVTKIFILSAKLEEHKLKRIKKKFKGIAILIFAILLFVSGTSEIVYCANQTTNTESVENNSESNGDKSSQTGKLDLNNLPDGIYSVDASSGNPMFNITECIFTVKNNQITMTIVLHGVGYDYLYFGTAKEAAKASESSWSKFYANSQGLYAYDLPISAVTKSVQISSRSKKYKKWYDRTISLNLKTFGLKSDRDNHKNNSSNNLDSNNNGNVNSNSDGKTDKDNSNKNNVNKKESKKDKDKKNSGNKNKKNINKNKTRKVKQQSASSKKDIDKMVSKHKDGQILDGTYTPSFGFTGGTGRVTLGCGKVVVKNGKATATIYFSSSNYTYVRIGGSKYYNNNKGGNSTFNIPINLNSTTSIYGLTTAMSEPHEIQYVLYIYVNGKNVSSIKPKKTYKTTAEKKKEAEKKEKEQEEKEKKEGNTWGAYKSIQTNTKQVTLTEEAESQTEEVESELIVTTENTKEGIKEKQKENDDLVTVVALIAICLLIGGGAIIIGRKRAK